MKKIIVALFAILYLISLGCTGISYSGDPYWGIKISGFPTTKSMTIINVDGTKTVSTINTTDASIDKSQNAFFNQSVFGEKINPISIDFDFINNDISQKVNLRGVFYALVGHGNPYTWFLRDIVVDNNITGSFLTFNDIKGRNQLPYIISKNMNNSNITLRYARSSYQKLGEGGMKDAQGALLFIGEVFDFVDESGTVIAEIAPENFKLLYDGSEVVLKLYKGSEKYRDEIIYLASIIYVLREWTPKMVDMLGYNE